MTPIKWFAATVGVVIGVSHIGMIGMVANRKGDKLPDLDINLSHLYDIHTEKDLSY